MSIAEIVEYIIEDRVEELSERDQERAQEIVEDPSKVLDWKNH